MPDHIKTKLLRRLNYSVKLVCIIVFTLGFSALIGWKFNISYFKSVLPNLPVMAPNTGITLILAAISLWLLGEDKSSLNRKRLGYILSAFIAAVGALTLFEYIGGINFGLDNLIFKNAIGANGLPVRMSPQSAANFTIIGIALLFLDAKTKTNKYPSQFLILMAGFIGLLSFLGFVHDLPGFYTISPYKGMAIQTAVAFILLFFGTIISRPQQGLMKIFSSDSISGFASRRLFTSLLFLAFADILIMVGQMNGYWSLATESIMHVALITIVFVYLIFIGFSSLDRIQTIEDVDQAKTEFVSFTSHQLREPLTAIRWHLSSVLDRKEESSRSKQIKCLENIREINNKMINLINSFLDVSKIELGTFASEKKMTDIKKTVEYVFSVLQPAISEKKIQLDVKYAADLPLIFIDPKILRIIFQNLLSNAVKYTLENGKIFFEVSLSSNKTAIQIKVSDTGCGIPQDQQSKIFTKLFRASNIKTADTKGTGLGLYLVSLLVAQTNGRIWFESIENKGSTFYVQLPIER